MVEEVITESSSTVQEEEPQLNTSSSEELQDDEIEIQGEEKVKKEPWIDLSTDDFKENETLDSEKVEESIEVLKEEISNATKPQDMWLQKEKEYTDKFANPYNAASRGYIDEVILPEQTRERVIRGFKMLENKAEKLPRKKHGNIPL